MNTGKIYLLNDTIGNKKISQVYVFSQIFSSLVGQNCLCSVVVSSWHIREENTRWLVILFIIENPCSRETFRFVGWPTFPSSPISPGVGETATVAGFSQAHVKTNANKLWEKKALSSPFPGFLHVLALVSKTDEAMWIQRSLIDCHSCSYDSGRNARSVHCPK